MEQMKYLPLGSIVVLHGGVQKLMIVGRGLNVKKDDETYFFDYGAVMFPQGLVGDELVYFDHIGIAKVVSYGYMDEDSAIIDAQLVKYVQDHPNIKRADPDRWNNR